MLILATGTALGAQTKLVFSSAQSGAVATDWTTQRFPEFIAKTGINVEHMNIVNNQTMEKIKTLMAAGQAPDVSMMSGEYDVALAMKGSFLDLEEVAKRFDPTFKFDDFFGPLLDAYRVDGHLYALPTDLDLSLMWYNKNMFMDAGISEPKDYSWDDFTAVSRKITKGQDANKIYAHNNIGAYATIMFMWQNGGDAISKDRKQVVINQPPAVGAIQYISDLIHVYGVIPTQVEENKIGGNMFLKSRAAMCMGVGPYYAWYSLRNVDFDWGVTTVPKGKYKVTSAGSSAISINATSKNVEEAWEFVKWFISPEQQFIRAQKFAWFPPGKSTLLLRGFMESDVLQMNQEQKMLVMNEAAYGRSQNVVEVQDTFLKVLLTELRYVWNGIKSPLDAAQTVHDSIQPLIK